MSKFIFPFAINPPLFPQREKVTQKSKKFQISLKNLRELGLILFLCYAYQLSPSNKASLTIFEKRKTLP